jgi:hypothetical protein
VIAAFIVVQKDARLHTGTVVTRSWVTVADQDGSQVVPTAAVQPRYRSAGSVASGGFTHPITSLQA